MTSRQNLTLLIAGMLLLAGAKLQAQSPAVPEKNDPEAKKILDKIRKKYDAYKSMEAAFNLVFEVPTHPKESHKGTISQEGKKFRFDMDDQTIVSDGVTTWVYQKKAKEIQINNADPNDANAFLTPKDLLTRYQKGDFLYAITDRTTENGKVLTQIEFKPKDKKSEYSKFRVAIDEKAGAIVNIKAFAKDGSRYTFTITRFSPNKAATADTYTFDPSSVKGAKVEDLRI